MNEKRKSASPGAIQVKNRRKTIGIKEKLDVISRLEKGEQAVDIRRNVRCAYTGMRRITTFRSTTDRIYDSGPIR